MAAGSALRTLQVVRPASINHLRSLPQCQCMLVNAAGPTATLKRLRRHGLGLTPLRRLKQITQQAIGCGKEMNWVLPKGRRRRCSSSIQRPGFSSLGCQVQADVFHSPMRAIVSRCKRPSRKLRSLEAAQLALGRMLFDQFTNNANEFNSRFSAGMPQSSEICPKKRSRTLKHQPSPRSALSNRAGAACSFHDVLSTTGSKTFARCSNPQTAELAAIATSHVLGRGIDFRRELSHLGRTALQAVRVEDLSPMAPQPEEQEAVDVKVAVGFVGERSDQVFSVQKVLPPPSVLLTVTLPKPLGIVFEESKIRKRVLVADLVPGGNAERAARVVQMFGPPKKLRQKGSMALIGGAVQKGDLLRGLTTTQCIVDLFGVRAPRRATVYFDTNYRRWGEIMGAFSAVRVSDGEITLVLERRLDRAQLADT